MNPSFLFLGDHANLLRVPRSVSGRPDAAADRQHVPSDDVDVERGRRRDVEFPEGVRDDASGFEGDASRRKDCRRAHQNDRRLQATLQAEVQIPA